MKKMVLVAASLHQGGIENVCVRTARYLQNQYDLKVVIFDSKDIAYDVEGLSIVDLNLPPKKGRFNKFIQMFKRGAALTKYYKENPFDISYSLGATANLANVFSRIPAKKWVSCHSYMDMSSPIRLKLFSKFSDIYFCCSEDIHRVIEEKYHCKHALVLNNPFDFDEIEKLSWNDSLVNIPWNNGERILVSMGREDDIKGYWHLIKIFSLIHREYDDTRLMILGKGEFTEYQKLAVELGVGDKVYFAGMQKNPYAYLKKCALYLLTSYNEGFPNALVEAMALGVPVISTDCMTGPREILKDDEFGFLVPNLSPDKDLTVKIDDGERIYANKAIKLLSDNTLLENYSQKAKERSHDYGKERYVEIINNCASL